MKKEKKEEKRKSKPLPRSGKILPGHFDFLPKSKKDSRGTEGREVEIIETIIRSFSKNLLLFFLVANKLNKVFEKLEIKPWSGNFCQSQRKIIWKKRGRYPLSNLCCEERAKHIDSSILSLFTIRRIADGLPGHLRQISSFVQGYKGKQQQSVASGIWKSRSPEQFFHLCPRRPDFNGTDTSRKSRGSPRSTIIVWKPKDRIGLLLPLN